VQVTDLGTGRTTTVLKGKSRPVSRRLDALFFTGNWLGWNDGHSHGHARNVATMKPAITFKRPLASVGRHDAVLASRVNLFTSNYYVASYRGHVKKVLSKASPYVVPQVDGHVFAWINALGQLEARAIPLPR
jgi:hypothetical protein